MSRWLIAVLSMALPGVGAAAALAAAHAAAARPAPAPQATPTAYSNAYPYRLIMTGPSESVEGEVIAYRLQYERVNHYGGGGLVLVYGNVPGTKLVGARGVVGPAPRVGPPMNPGLSENIGLPGASGTVEFDLQPVPGFVGKLLVAVYVRGTSIVMPAGTVDRVVTNVVPRAALPRTGTPPNPATGGVRRWGVAGLAALALLAGAGVMGLAVVRARASARR